MDWATLFKDYPQLIPAIAGIAGIVLGYFSNSLINRTKRKHELEDREFARRVTVYDKRIKEAEDFIEEMEAFTNVLSRFIINTLYFLLDEEKKELNLEVLMADVDNSFKAFSPEKIEQVKKSSLKILDDKELIDLHKEIQEIMLPILRTNFEILDKLNVDGITDKSIFDDLKVMDEGVKKVDALIIKMRKRLDKLASELE